MKISRITIKTNFYPFFSFKVKILSYDETMVKDCENLLQKWLEVGENEVDNMTVDEYKNMQPLQQIEFLSQLRQVL